MATQPVVTTQSRHIPVSSQTRQIPLRNPYTTVNQPVKKDGAGGAFTWGGVGDVKDFELLGAQRAPTVTTRPATVLSSSITIPVGSANVVGTPKADTPLNVNSFAQFPAMGVGTSPNPVTWGPGALQPQRVVSAQSVAAPTISYLQTPASSAAPVTTTSVRPLFTTQSVGTFPAGWAGVNAQSPIASSSVAQVPAVQQQTGALISSQSIGTFPAGWMFVNPQSPTASPGVAQVPAVQQQAPAKAVEAEKKEDKEASKEDATEQEGKSKEDGKEGNCSIQ